MVKWEAPHIDWSPWTRHSAYSEGGDYSELEPEARAAAVNHDLFQQLSQRKGEDSKLQQVGGNGWG